MAMVVVDAVAGVAAAGIATGRAYRHIIAYSALAGDPVTARDAIEKLEAANPGVAVTMTTGHPLRHVSRLYDVLAKGWRLAGLLEE